MKPVIYTTQSCQFCKMTKAFFNQKGVEYEEKDVGTDLEARQEMVQRSGQLGVPVTVIGENVVVGFNKEALDKLTD